MLVLHTEQCATADSTRRAWIKRLSLMGNIGGCSTAGNECEARFREVPEANGKVDLALTADAGSNGLDPSTPPTHCIRATNEWWRSKKEFFYETV